MLRFRSRYLFFSVLLLAMEICIAVFVHDRLIRPFIGDMLVVVLLYCMLKTFWNTSNARIAAFVLTFALVVECLQYFKLAAALGLGRDSIAGIALGSTFDPVDILAYGAGILFVLLAEWYCGVHSSQRRNGL